jgi:hypothetical protein
VSAFESAVRAFLSNDTRTLDVYFIDPDCPAVDKQAARRDSQPQQVRDTINRSINLLRGWGEGVSGGQLNVWTFPAEDAEWRIKAIDWDAGVGSPLIFLSTYYEPPPRAALAPAICLRPTKTGASLFAAVAHVLDDITRQAKKVVP